MKRLYNEHGGCPREGSAKQIEELMTDAFTEVWNRIVLSNDMCSRDVEAHCHNMLSILFAENRLRRVMNMKMKERTDVKL